jgi:hypothetical protein
MLFHSLRHFLVNICNTIDYMKLFPLFAKQRGGIKGGEYLIKNTLLPIRKAVHQYLFFIKSLPCGGGI